MRTCTQPDGIILLIAGKSLVTVHQKKKKEAHFNLDLLFFPSMIYASPPPLDFPTRMTVATPVTFEKHINTDPIMCRNSSAYAAALIIYRGGQSTVVMSEYWFYKIPLIWLCCKGTLEASQKVYPLNQLQLRAIKRHPRSFQILKLLQSRRHQASLTQKPVIKQLILSSCCCLFYWWCLFKMFSFLFVFPSKPTLFNILRWPFSLFFPQFCHTQRAALVCAMEMVGAHWVTMAGTVCASWAGGALAVTPPWKLPAVMSRTTTEVKSQTAPAWRLPTLARRRQELSP